jgi:hypothetical protein
MTWKSTLLISGSFSASANIAPDFQIGKGAGSSARDDMTVKMLNKAIARI